MTAWIVPPLAAACAFGALALFVWKRRPPAPLWPYLLLIQLCALFWVVGELGTMFARDRREEWLALLLLYTGSIPIGALWWHLSLGFAELHGRPSALGRGPGRWLPLALAASFWLLFVSNPWHGLYLEPVVGGRNVHHPLWWLHALSSWVLVIGAALHYAALAWRAEPGSRLRSQSVLLIGASLPVVGANAVYVALPGPWPLDLSVLVGSLSCALFVIGIYATGLFELPPVALREAIQQDPTGVLLLDRFGQVRLINPAARSLLDDPRLGPGTAASAPDLLDGLLEADETFEGAIPPWHRPDGPGGLFRVRRKGGRVLWVTCAHLPRRGRPVGTWLRLVDVTPLLELERTRRSLEARLRRAERLESLGVLAAGIAHEINTPLGSILLAAEHALRSLGEPTLAGSAEEALETVVSEARRCGRIVRNVLKFAREESTEKWPIDVNRVARRAAERISKGAEERGAQLELTLDPRLPLVRANPTDLEQMLVNLLENALENGPPGLRLELQTLRSDGGVRLRVCDDGPGMSEEVRARAFDPFFSTRAEGGGTGLGLSLVHGIVREHGGTLELQSEPGQGTRVSIELPPSRGIAGASSSVRPRAGA